MAKFRTPAIILLLLMFVLSFSTGVVGEDDVFGGLPGVPPTSGSSQSGAAASTSTVGSSFVDQDSLRDFVALLRSLSQPASDPTDNGDVSGGGEGEPETAFTLGTGEQQQPTSIAVIRDDSVSYIVLQSEVSDEAEPPGEIDNPDNSGDGSNDNGRDSEKPPKGVPGIGSDTPDEGPDGDPTGPPDKKGKDKDKNGNDNGKKGNDKGKKG